MDKLNIGVIFGGKTDEYEVSIHSAANVLRALDESKYNVSKVGVTREGRWYVTAASPEEIESDSWLLRADNMQCSIPHDPTVQGMLVYDSQDKASVRKIDCFVPVMHGDHVEDGEIQGLLSLAEIPFVGPGVKASANCMDKTCAKQLARLTGVNMARDYIVRKHAFVENAAGEIAAAAEVHGGAYPLFVKPSSAGSSVGVTKVHSFEELGPAIEEALKYDNKVLVEEAIVGREIEVAVLGNDEPVASSVGEILTAGEFYSYNAKYENPESRTRVVEDLPAEVLEEIRETAVLLYRELDCRGLSRVDMFYKDADEGTPAKDRIYFNEINTLPGFTNISMYPALWRHDGLDTPQLIDRLIELALEP